MEKYSILTIPLTGVPSFMQEEDVKEHRTRRTLALKSDLIL